MSAKRDVYPGAKIGRWTVLEKYEEKPRRWKCRCECGAEREVSDHGLRYGSSTSCGCLRSEKALQSNAHELNGRRFGKLTVLGRTFAHDKRSGRWWRCLCDCGNEISVPGTLLYTGRKTSCGCANIKNYAFVDIKGQRFNRLTALYPLEERTDKGGMIWHCRCDCGNELDVSYNELAYSNLKSCGCRKKEHDMMLKEFLPHVDGTSISHLRSRKTPSNNTTGVKGVYLIRGKYVAKIVFQKKQYLLGSYDNLADAAEARREAEEALNDRVTTFYDRWKMKADADPAWAASNPIRINVERSGGVMKVSMLPDMREQTRVTGD